MLQYVYVVYLVCTSMHHEDILQSQSVAPLKTKIYLDFV